MLKQKVSKISMEKLAVFKQPLAEQAAKAIRQVVQQKKWVDSLPGEVEMSSYLCIGRSTLRQALNLLVEQGFLSKSKGKHTRIVGGNRRPRATVPESDVVRLLTPKHVEEFTPFMFRWFLKYRSMMRGIGVDLELSTTPGLFTRFSSRKMELHVKSLPARLWLLHVSSFPMQCWFLDNRIPFILAGTPHQQIEAPFVDTDQRASARHAGGLLLAAGHRSLAIITSATKFAGDVSCIAGLRDAIRTSPIGEPIHHEIIEYNESADSLARALVGRLRQPTRPTALVVCHQWTIPGVLCALNQLGIRFPKDISLVCLQAAPFMRYMSPRLSHYTTNADLFANKLSDLSRRFLKTRNLPHTAHLITPTFVAGESITRPPG